MRVFFNIIIGTIIGLVITSAFMFMVITLAAWAGGQNDGSWWRL